MLRYAALMRGQPPQDVKDFKSFAPVYLDAADRKKKNRSGTLLDHTLPTPTLVTALAAHRVDTSRLAHPAKIFVQHGGDLRLCGGRHIGLIPEGAASPLLASGMLVRTGLIEIPVRYWMFALRERDIDLLAAYVTRVAGAVANRGARLRRLNRCNP